MRRLGKLFLGVVFAFAVANATIIPSLVNVTPDVTAGESDFNYQAQLTGTEQLNTGAIGIDPIACTGGNSTNCLPFFTIYDLPNGSFNSVSSTPTDWGVSFQLTGVTPSTINASFDDGALVNVTFYYTGVTIIGPENFTGFTIVTNPGWSGTNPNGSFTSQATENSSLLTDQTAGSIAIPAATSGVPEPASTLLMGSGLLALGLFGRRLTKRRS